MRRLGAESLHRGWDTVLGPVRASCNESECSVLCFSNFPEVDEDRWGMRRMAGSTRSSNEGGQRWNRADRIGPRGCHRRSVPGVPGVRICQIEKENKRECEYGCLTSTAV